MLRKEHYHTLLFSKSESYTIHKGNESYTTHIILWSKTIRRLSHIHALPWGVLLTREPIPILLYSETASQVKLAKFTNCKAVYDKLLSE